MTDTAIRKSFRYTADYRKAFRWIKDGYLVVAFDKYGRLYQFKRDGDSILSNSGEYAFGAGSFKFTDREHFFQVVNLIYKVRLRFIEPSKRKTAPETARERLSKYRKGDTMVKRRCEDRDLFR